MGAKFYGKVWEFKCMIGRGKTKNTSWIWRGIEGSKCIIEKAKIFFS